MKYWIRTQLMPSLLAPILRMTGYRFDKSWRHGETRFKEFVYTNVVCTFVTNVEADSPGAVKYWRWTR